MCIFIYNQGLVKAIIFYFIIRNSEAVKYIVDASNFPDLNSLIEYQQTWNKPFMFGLDWTSSLAPDGRTTVGIGVRGVIWAFTLHGGIYLANGDNPYWTEIKSPIISN